jgi:hypothetical protein
LEEAKKHLASMKKEAGDDKETAAAITKIENKLTHAFDMHTKLCDCCKDASFKQIHGMECCNDLATELDQIMADHGAVMRKQAHKSVGK